MSCSLQNTEHPLTETLFAMADAMVESIVHPENNSSENVSISSLKERFNFFMIDDKARYLLSDKGVRVDLSPIGNNAVISINDNTISKERRVEKLEAIAETLMKVNNYG